MYFGPYFTATITILFDHLFNVNAAESNQSYVLTKNFIQQGPDDLDLKFKDTVDWGDVYFELSGELSGLHVQ